MAFTFVHLILGHFSYFARFMRILNNCKTDQQENLVALHSFKINYLNSSRENFINFNTVFCIFNKNFIILPKNNLHENPISPGLFIDNILEKE